MPLHSALTGAELHNCKIHATTHAVAGSDPVTPAAIGALATTAGAVLTANLADGAVTALKVAADVATQAELDAVASAKANTSHAHAAADVTSGVLATARLGTGVADATTFLRGDQTFAALPSTSAHAATHQAGGTDAFTGIVPASAFAPAGLAGAVAASRYAGATTSGAPTVGTFAVGDYVIARNGGLHICTVAGTPGTWVAVGGAGRSVPDPRTNPFDFDDFYVASTTSGQIGKLGWLTSSGTTGTTGGSAGHPGQVRRQSAATIGSYAHLMLDVSTFNGFIAPTDVFESTSILELIQVDANTVCRFGLLTQMVAAPSGGIYFERLGADTNWFAVCRNSSVETRLDTGHTAAVAWVVGMIRRVDASTIGFRIGATVAAALASTELTITTNIPTSLTNAVFTIGTLEAVAKAMDVDYWDLRFTNLAR